MSELQPDVRISFVTVEAAESQDLANDLADVNKYNDPERDAIVDRIEKCIADPRYDGLTFGVISLLGMAQARRIQALLLERLQPDEWSARDLRCGDAADFQGS